MGHDLFAHACKARPLTIVGWTSLSVPLSLSSPLLPPVIFGAWTCVLAQGDHWQPTERDQAVVTSTEGTITLSKFSGSLNPTPTHETHDYRTNTRTHVSLFPLVPPLFSPGSSLPLLVFAFYALPSFFLLLRKTTDHNNVTTQTAFPFTFRSPICFFCYVFPSWSNLFHTMSSAEHLLWTDPKTCVCCSGHSNKR